MSAHGPPPLTPESDILISARSQVTREPQDPPGQEALDQSRQVYRLSGSPADSGNAGSPRSIALPRRQDIFVAGSQLKGGQSPKGLPFSIGGKHCIRNSGYPHNEWGPKKSNRELFQDLQNAQLRHEATDFIRKRKLKEDARFYSHSQQRTGQHVRIIGQKIQGREEVGAIVSQSGLCLPSFNNSFLQRLSPSTGGSGSSDMLERSSLGYILHWYNMQRS